MKTCEIVRLPEERRYLELEPSIRDLRRMARLAEKVLHQAVGELAVADGKIIELPDLEEVLGATLAVDSYPTWRSGWSVFTIAASWQAERVIP